MEGVQTWYAAKTVRNVSFVVLKSTASLQLLAARILVLSSCPEMKQEHNNVDLGQWKEHLFFYT